MSWIKQSPKDLDWWAGGLGGGADIYPQSSNIVFSADLLTNLTASVGTTPTFARASSMHYATGAATMGTVASGNPAFGTLWGYGTYSSYVNLPSWTNRIPRSENIAAGWASVGAPTLTQPDATVTDPWGTSISGKILANGANEGIQQSAALTAVSRRVQASLWAKSATGGNVAITITLEGDAGGVPETSTYARTVTTSWTRIYTDKKTFTAAATGNVRYKITIDTNTDAINLMGMQLCLPSSDTEVNNVNHEPYITTAAGTGAQVDNALTISSADLTNAMVTGTLNLWIIPCDDSADIVSQYTLARMGAGINFNLSSTQFKLTYTSSAVAKNGTISRQTPCMVTATWDNTANPAAGTFEVWKNGSSLGSSTAIRATPAAANMTLGGFPGNPNQCSNGLISRCKIWKVTLSSTEMTQLYNAEKGYYGL